MAQAKPLPWLRPHAAKLTMKGGTNTTHTDTGIDWLACELIEQIPGKVSGRPIVRGTRILPGAIVDSTIWGKP